MTDIWTQLQNAVEAIRPTIRFVTEVPVGEGRSVCCFRGCWETASFRYVTDSGDWQGWASCTHPDHRKHCADRADEAARNTNE